MTSEEIKRCQRLRAEVAAFCEEMSVHNHAAQHSVAEDWQGRGSFFLGAATASLMLLIVLGAHLAGPI